MDGWRDFGGPVSMVLTGVVIGWATATVAYEWHGPDEARSPVTVTASDAYRAVVQCSPSVAPLPSTTSAGVAQSAGSATVDSTTGAVPGNTLPHDAGKDEPAEPNRQEAPSMEPPAEVLAEGPPLLVTIGTDPPADPAELEASLRAQADQPVPAVPGPSGLLAHEVQP